MEGLKGMVNLFYEMVVVRKRRKIEHEVEPRAMEREGHHGRE